ncbi:hypothetical protein GPLA_4016 [Paraglaciecola polaris LMG 21857]|uniref:Uncharacterized protein n=1 Tax=Paraglaciecola polaris LMG 21857 TaxID=1129793 RepID=K7AI22_9ALTE|nr:hypothetical protein GPLA_4016 [Paraglaciecola polaris LMG 21857]
MFAAAAANYQYFHEVRFSNRLTNGAGYQNAAHYGGVFGG